MADVLAAVSSSTTNVPRFTISSSETSAMNGKVETISECRVIKDSGDDDEEKLSRLNVSTSESNGKNSLNSPRYEAFVMTGEKILRLNPKISPSYAKLRQSELPKGTQVCDSSPMRGPFADLENNFHYHNSQLRNNERKRKIQNGHVGENGEHLFCKVSASLSENVLTQQESDVTVNNQEDNLFNFDRNASLITVQGNFESVETCSNNYSAQTLRLYDNYGSGLIDLPSPAVTYFVSEPSTPAKFSFDKHNKIEKTVVASKSLVNFDELVEPGILVLEKTSENCTEEPLLRSADERRNGTTTTSSSVASISQSLSSSVASTPLKEKLRQLESTPAHQPLNDNDVEAAKRLANRLYNLDGFKKSDVSKHLAKNNEFGNMVSLEYLKLFNFVDLKLDEAIRKLLSQFCLTGETSERERILWYFSRRYHECNPNLFSAEDEVHTLTCALLLLNTDLHGQNVTKRMSCNDFVENISQTGFKYSKTLLKSFYHSIKMSPIEWARDNIAAQNGKKSSSSNGRSVELPDPDSQVVYKKGFVMRKCVVENDGKSTPFGRRSWRMFYATLKGMILYLHQDENGFKKGSFLTFRNSIRIHHAFAVKAVDYTKKQNVFRLQTASLAEYLFQTSNQQELDEWMDEINYVAARYSSPSLPSCVSSSSSMSSVNAIRFYRQPSLPTTRTKLSFKEQLKSHESHIEELSKQLLDIRKTLPSRNAKSKVLQNYAENEISLLLELERYSTYVHLLQNRITSRRESLTTNNSSMPAMSLLGELVETSNEDLRNNNHNESNISLANVKSKDQKGNQSDRNSYKAAITDCMKTKEILETNF